MKATLRCRSAALVAVTLTVWGASAIASETNAPPSYDWYACEDEARRLEIAEKIPNLLLTAVTITETGRRGPQGRRIMSWPWTLHAEGKSLHYATKAEAVTAVRDFMKRGVRNVDVGCMQINLRYHPHAFTSVEEALDPVANLAYGVSYLRRLEARRKGWPAAIRHYHSANRSVNERYRQKVFAVWDQLRRRAAANRVRNGVSAETAAHLGNDLRLFVTPSAETSQTVFARRESRRAWTVHPATSPNASKELRESLNNRRFKPLPMQKHRPHARVIVALQGRMTGPQAAPMPTPVPTAQRQDDETLFIATSARYVVENSNQ